MCARLSLLWCFIAVLPRHHLHIKYVLWDDWMHKFMNTRRPCLWKTKQIKRVQKEKHFYAWLQMRKTWISICGISSYCRCFSCNELCIWPFCHLSCVREEIVNPSRSNWSKGKDYSDFTASWQTSTGVFVRVYSLYWFISFSGSLAFSLSLSFFFFQIDRYSLSGNIMSTPLSAV